jgi:hypothetical protein
VVLTEVSENSSQAFIPCTLNFGSYNHKNCNSEEGTENRNLLVYTAYKLLLWLRSVISLAVHCPQESSHDSAYDGGISSATGSQEPTPVAVCPIVLTRRLRAQKVKK